jgi:DNA polymerase III subunit gamma/tau
VPPAAPGERRAEDQTEEPGPARQHNWAAVVEAVEKESSMAATALKQAVVLGLCEGEVAVQIPSGMYAATLEKRRAEIEAALGRFYGRPTRLALSIGTPAPAAGEPAPAPSPSLAAAEAAERTARGARVREAARANPNIQEAARVLDAKIDKIDEL